MAETSWHSGVDPQPLLDVMRERTRNLAQMPSRKLQLAGVASVRRMAHYLTQRGQAALAVAERMADEVVPADERQAALHDIGDGSGRPGGILDGPDDPGPKYSTDPRVEVATVAVMTLVAPGLDGFIFARTGSAMTRVAEVLAPNGHERAAERAAQAALVREVFGNPFRSVTFSPTWRTVTAVALARQMYESRDFDAMSILADALQDAGCDDEVALNHCRGLGPHVRGCWVVDLVLGKSNVEAEPVAAPDPAT